jgi:hypothetical protein
MPKALGVKGTYQAIRSANGPAQHIAVSLVGLTYAGMFTGMVPDAILWAWAISSALVLTATVWLNKVWLKRSLLLDFTLSCMVLKFYFMNDAAPTEPVYHVMSADGMQMASRGNHGMSMIDTFSHALACVMMAGWSLYLSNLVQRQLLEAQRFEVAFDGGVLK